MDSIHTDIYTTCFKLDLDYYVCLCLYTRIQYKEYKSLIRTAYDVGQIFTIVKSIYKH